MPSSRRNTRKRKAVPDTETEPNVIPNSLSTQTPAAAVSKKLKFMGQNKEGRKIRRRMYRKTQVDGMNSAEENRQLDTNCMNRIQWQQDEDKHLWASLGGWFLGPKAENIDIFSSLAATTFQMHADFRRSLYFPTDPPIITQEMKQHESCKVQKIKTETELNKVCEELQKSIPWASMRYQAHQTGDVTIQAFLGYIAGLLYNANNVASEGSPVTTKIEKDVGDQLCTMIGFGRKDMPRPWGHITSCGSVAILETVWSSRNVKFYPFGVKKGLDDPRLEKARGYEVTVCGKRKKLAECSQWELLNLDIDEIVQMPEKVKNMAEVETKTYSSIVDDANLPNIGFHDVFKTFEIKNSPVIIVPQSRHYAWAKASGLLGIGEKHMKEIAVDRNGRMQIKPDNKNHIEGLEDTLQKHLDEQIPVISVVAVIGATETSAVDELSEIVKLRDKFRKKGLNFAINVDAAWGGYFCTMLEPIDEKESDGSAYVPDFPLSEYTKTQLRAMKEADTVVCDPHKTGFVAYPAGGMCYRNGAMRGFVKRDANYISHGDSHLEVGMWGVQGSKPGAAAVGVSLSHKVIGLNNNGYGRILGQCTFGAKILYCVWLTLAKDSDDFVCVPLKPLPKNMILADVKGFIRDRILGKTNAEIKKDKEAMELLREIGPDMLITAFAINKRKNKILKICNDINQNVFERSSPDSIFYSLLRVKLFLTSSKLPECTPGTVLKDFKQRLGVEGAGDLTFLINTNVNPWTTVNLEAYEIGKVLRQTVMLSIGQVTDVKDKHSFLCVGFMTEDGEIFGEYIPSFLKPQHRYQSVIKVRFLDQNAITAVRKIQTAEKCTSSEPIIFQTKDCYTLGDFLQRGKRNETTFNVWKGLPSPTNLPFLKNQDLLVLDTPLVRPLDLSVTEYPPEMSYFLYGDKNGAYISHNIRKEPSFQQIVMLDDIPGGIPEDLLVQGIDITIPRISGTPVKDTTGKFKDPLRSGMYSVHCKVDNGQTITSDMSLTRPWAKVYFDQSRLNKD